ncbi:MAG: glycosyltransferase family 2 protein [Patescibacteria group bacterium]|nr:glycosyltransferase family 2 protein [Patescibacteria group bacterium]
MKVSAVVIAYNEEKYIKNCLESLTSQTEKADEIILVDNNSTDRTVEIAKQFPEVRIVKEGKQGMIYARNKGFDSAKYELITRCDSDTRVSKDWIKNIKKHFEAEKIDALSGPLRFFDVPQTRFHKILADIYNDGAILVYQHRILDGPNMSLTKEIWEKVRDKVCLIDKDVHEDADLAIHIVKAGGKVKYFKDVLADASGRRLLHNPSSFFLEYPWKHIKTRFRHLI